MNGNVRSRPNSTTFVNRPTAIMVNGKPSKIHRPAYTMHEDC